MKSIQAFLNILIATITLLIQLGCSNSEGVKPIDYGDVPRKSVPAELVGDWFYSSVSGTNYHYPNGHTAPAWAFGSTFHINADGTGFQVIRADVNTQTSETSQRIEEDGAFEIDLGGDGSMSFKFYPVRGKLYDNDVFSHDLTSEKLYPNKVYSWKCERGKDSAGAYFVSGELTYHKK